jgi:16S rRNA (cytidine1402-2'-O)-methyltransferase
VRGKVFDVKKFGTLFIIATPIGNPRDISARAIEVLNSVDVVACEDTRTFKDLGQQLGLSIKKTLSHHEHNEKESANGLIALLGEGKNVALVSDAGTPNVSDPGYDLLQQARQSGVKVVPIPGASSLTAALSIAPIGGRKVFFGGFAPVNSSERRDEMKSAAAISHKIVYLEAPHRVVENLEDALAVFGDTDVCIVRELTKTYEEVLNCKVTEALEHFKNKPPKGEFVLVFRSQDASGPEDVKILERKLIERLKDGVRASDIVKEFQGQTSLKKKALYDLVLKLKEQL